MIVGEGILEKLEKFANFQLVAVGFVLIYNDVSKA